MQTNIRKDASSAKPFTIIGKATRYVMAIDAAAASQTFLTMFGNVAHFVIPGHQGKKQ